MVLSEKETLQRHGHELISYLRKNDEIKEFGTPEKVRFLAETVYSKRTARDLRNLVQTNRPDVAYVHNIYPLISPSLYHVLHAVDIPVVQCVHDFRPLCANGFFYTQKQCCERCKEGNYLHAVTHRCYRDSYLLSGLYAFTLGVNRFASVMNKVSAFICLNEFYRTKFLEAGVPSEKLFVRPNSVDPMKPLGADKAKERYALYFGRLSQEKGLGTLLRAFEEAAPARLKIAGTGPMEDELKRYVREKRLYNIEMVGFVGGQEKWELLRNALFAIIPSEWHENCPVSALEFFAAGTAIVASRMGGLSSIVSEGQTGLLFKAGDAKEIAEKVRYMFSHPFEAERMGKHAREVAEIRYSKEQNYQQLMNIFQKVLGDRMSATAVSETAVA